MSFKKFWIESLFIAVTALLFNGCQSQQAHIPQLPTKTFDLSINIDPSIAGESITIDMFAVSGSNMNYFKTMRWSNYLTDQRNKLKEIKVQVPVRKDNLTELPYVCSISYTQGKPTQYTLTRKDSQWNAWKQYNGEYLVVFTDLSSVSSGPLIIPLHQNCWKTGSIFSMYQNSININLNFQGIQYFPSSLCMIQ